MRELTVMNLLPQRLDQYLLEQYPHLGMGRINKAFRENKIKLNGKKLPLNTRVIQGDVIALYLKDEQLEAPGKRDLDPKSILYEDDGVLILNKPAGLPVDGGEDSLLERARVHSPSARLCHRLDTGTSGLVMLAKTNGAEKALTQLIRERTVEKTYLCVTFGRPQPPAATLHGWLEKDSAKGMVYVHTKKETAQSKEVLTRYRTVAVSGRLALLEVDLITGRTHQIRAHLASIGCPILGDSKYGNNAANRELKLKYQALCAWRLRFPSGLEGVLSGLSEREITVPKPWYCGQVVDGTLK